MAVLEIWYSAVYGELWTHFSSFQGDIAKPFKTNKSSKKQRFQRLTVKTNDIRWRNSLAVLIHEKHSFKSLQDVSVLVSNTL